METDHRPPWVPGAEAIVHAANLIKIAGSAAEVPDRQIAGAGKTVEAVDRTVEQSDLAIEAAAKSLRAAARAPS